MRPNDSAAPEYEESVGEASRRTNWIYTGRIIADHPLGGIGFGEQQFLRAMNDYGYATSYGRLYDNPHNSYLQMTVYAGIPVLLVFLLPTWRC